MDYNRSEEHQRAIDAEHSPVELEYAKRSSINPIPMLEGVLQRAALFDEVIDGQPGLRAEFGSLAVHDPLDYDEVQVEASSRDPWFVRVVDRVMSVCGASVVTESAGDTVTTNANIYGVYTVRLRKS